MNTTPKKDSQGSKQTSPYKKMASRNSGYVQYKSVEALTKDKPYKIYDIKPTEHERYGHGQLMFIQTNTHPKYKVQMPKKYLLTLSDPDDINTFKADIAKKENPYLVFRERLPDKGFRINIMQSDEQIKEKYKNWEDVDELADSGNLNDSEKNTPPSPKKPKGTE